MLYIYAVIFLLYILISGALILQHHIYSIHSKWSCAWNYSRPRNIRVMRGTLLCYMCLFFQKVRELLQIQLNYNGFVRRHITRSSLETCLMETIVGWLDPDSVCEWSVSDSVVKMVLTSPEHSALALSRTRSPVRTLPLGVGSVTKARQEKAKMAGEARLRASTLPHLSLPSTSGSKGVARNEPMFSRNIPATFSVLNCPSDKEDLSFSNRW